MDIFSLSQDEIYQTFGGIDLDPIFKKKVLPVWAFTNEKLASLLELTTFDGKQVFAIGGSGDQAAAMLAAGAENLVLCDKRDLACLFIELKFSAIKNLNFSEFHQFFGLSSSLSANRVYFEKIRGGLSRPSQTLFDRLFARAGSIYQILRKSKLFYKESWYFARKGYIPYLTSPDLFQKIRTKRPAVINADLIQALEFVNSKFDLIYLSNILDSRKYSEDPSRLLKVVRGSLRDDGQLLIVSQSCPRRMASTLRRVGLRITKRVAPRKPFLYPFVPTYLYWYLLVQPLNLWLKSVPRHFLLQHI